MARDGLCGAVGERGVVAPGQLDDERRHLAALAHADGALDVDDRDAGLHFRDGRVAPSMRRRRHLDGRALLRRCALGIEHDVRAGLVRRSETRQEIS